MENQINEDIRKISTKSIIMLILAVIAVITVGTFAWLTYRSNDTAMVLTIGEIDGMTVTLKPYQINTSLVPTNDYSTQEYVNVSANNKKTKGEKFRLYYQVDSIDSALINNSFKYTIVKSTNNWSSQTVVKEGNFSTASSGNELEIYTETVPGNNTTYQYRVYLWIDSTDGNQTSMQGKVFKGELRAEIISCDEPVTSPYLDSGMIPVTISDTGVVTSVSQNDSNWYSYCDQKWANAVLVKETGTKTRAANKVAGTTINPNDILAYFVWIPRYSYKVWQYEGVADTVQEQTINIKFVDTNTKELATKNGEYYTHPAFTFGTKELAGIWVGKFETSTDPTDTCYTTPNETNCTYDKVTPRIVPTVDSLRYQNISNEFQTALKFAGGSMTNNVVSFTGSKTYGLTTATDSHMMKNSEWGAVTYLSHSKYGINTEIRINNFRESSSNYYRTSTGCGANSANTSTVVTTCAIPYGTPSSETYSYPQSTTGNISGIFDMSGGAYEYTMCNWGNTTKNSGLAAVWFTNNSKYYNLYDSSIFTGTYSTNFTFCTLATCGGHALNETKSWYSDYAFFVNSGAPWTGRGGGAGDNKYAGAFGASHSYGGASYTNSFRGVLVASGT